MNKLVKKISTYLIRFYLIRQGLFIILPFVLYYGVLFYDQKNFLHTILGKILLYFWLLIGIFYFILYQTEQIIDFLENKSTKFKFLLEIILIIIFLSLTFTSFYYVLYQFDLNSFNNVSGNNFLTKYTDFLYFSNGILLMNNQSQIIAQSTYAKLFTSTEMFTAFIMLIFILGNMKSLKNLFNDHKKVS